MKTKKNFLKSITLPAVMLVLAVIAPILSYAARSTWVFVNLTVKFEIFTYVLLGLMIVNAIVLGGLTAIRANKFDSIYSKKSFSVAIVITSLLSIAFFIAGLSFSFGMLSSESAQAYTLYLKKSLEDAVLIALPIFLVLFYPACNCKTKRSILSVVVIVISILGLSKLIPLDSYKITCDPSVLDTGKDYSIVFATNDFGTGYVEYEYKGKPYKVYDHQGGRLSSDSKIHSVNVPYEHLNNNSYKIGSVRVIEQYSYGSRTGKEITSDEYTFTPVKGDDITYLVVSDWHTYLDRAHEAISYIGDYDAVILLGDATPGVDFEEQVVTNIVEFSGSLSKGTLPTLYVRGNHETRGEYAGKILNALGLDEFYYTADMGNYSFVVLDSGEDKDDSHPEYGGMTDYNTYRADMIEWLKGADVKNDKVIALSHSWRISDVEPELSVAGWNEIERLGAKLMISGHHHQCRLIGANGGSEAEFLSAYPGITAYLDGGKMNDGTYVASKMTLSSDEIYLEAFRNNGEKLLEHTIKW